MTATNTRAGNFQKMLALEELLRKQATAAAQMAASQAKAAIDTTLEASSGDIESLQVEQQYGGQRADNSPIIPSYAQSTIKRKKRKGQPYDRVTLRDTQAFHDQMKARYDSGKFAYFVSSPVEYTKYLVKRYSAEIFGLNDQFLNGFRILIQDDLIKSIVDKFKSL